MILIDTDHLSILADRRAARHPQLTARLKAVEEPIAISVVAVEEQVRGWLAQLHRIGDAHNVGFPHSRAIVRGMDDATTDTRRQTCSGHGSPIASV